MNPFEPPNTNDEPGTIRWSWFVCGGFVAASLIGLSVSTQMAGIHGLFCSIYVVSLCWFLISRTQTPLLHPLNSLKISPSDFSMLFVMCVILHALWQPVAFVR